MKRQNYKKKLQRSRKNDYDFDKKLELKIYNNVCGNKKNIEKTLLAEYRFKTYTEWEMYIVEKYENYSLENLINFDAFLLNASRKYESGDTSFSMFAVGLTSIIFSFVFNDILKRILNGINSINLLGYFVLSILISIVAGTIIVIFFLCVDRAIYKSNYRKNMYIDYRKVISKIIEKKKKVEMEKLMKKVNL